MGVGVGVGVEAAVTVKDALVPGVSESPKVCVAISVTPVPELDNVTPEMIT